MASLNPLQGPLGKRLAAHLLRRATYSISPQDIEAFANLSATQAVDQLFQDQALFFPDGPEGWTVQGPAFSKTRYRIYQGQLGVGGHNTFVSGWRYYEMIHSKNIRWKIVSWFSSLFVIALRIPDIVVFQYWLMLSKMAFGDLQSLAEKVSFDSAMSHYLNNNINTKDAPNENYAREFLELFTILKGENIALGNYTNYTEADISEAAKVFSGFYFNGSANHAVDAETGIRRCFANINNHTPGDKVFSSAFQNRTITGAANSADMYREVKDFIQMVFDQEETARAYIRKMYLFFVADKISEVAEQDIIRPLASELKTNGYQHIPILKKLLMSEHFYDKDNANAGDEIIGAKIKPVWEMMCQSVSIFDLENKSNGNNELLFYRDPYAFAKLADDMGLPVAGPNSVEGFAGYYKSPDYSRNWLTNNVLYPRFSMADVLLNGIVRNNPNRFPYQLDIVKWVKDTIDLPNGPGTPSVPIGAADAARVVEMMMDYLLPERPTGDRYDFFMSRLL
ncbi:MAG: DUF1800 family protein [Bacteroidota bacterium]